MPWRLLKRFNDWLESPEPEETFKVNFYCKSCRNENTFYFSVGTRISRAPYLGHDNAETIIILPNVPVVEERQVLKCKHCIIGNVA